MLGVSQEIQGKKCRAQTTLTVVYKYPGGMPRKTWLASVYSRCKKYGHKSWLRVEAVN